MLFDNVESGLSVLCMVVLFIFMLYIDKNNVVKFFVVSEFVFLFVNVIFVGVRIFNILFSFFCMGLFVIV